MLNLQGDVVMMLDQDGNVVAEYAYTAWGQLRSASGRMAFTNPLRYRGYYYDSETGFYYLQSRYYDPSLHRFINADAYASTGQSFIGTNMFAYCNNNPVAQKDASGNIPNHCVMLTDTGGGSKTTPSTRAVTTQANNSSKWYGAESSKQTSVITAEKTVPLAGGLGALTYTQTMTSSCANGEMGDWFGAYAYQNTLIDDLGRVDSISYGAGIRALYLLGVEVHTMFLGVGLTGTLHFGDTSIYISGEVNLTEYSSVSVGFERIVSDSMTINDNFAIEGNTYAVMAAVCYLLTGQNLPIPQRVR